MISVSKMVTDGFDKTPILESGGVLLASTSPCASIVLGQDMAVGFVGPNGSQIEFTVSESLTLRVRQPEAICMLNG